MFFKQLILSIFIASSVISTVGQPPTFPVPSGNSKQLFYLQRTSNTNTILYEINFRNGVIDVENPVHESWIRYQEKGQREELTYIQRKFAYGIKAKKIAANKYELSFVSYKKYKMHLELGADNKYYVYTIINQKRAILKSVFLQINGGSFWSPNIEYVEITGQEPITHVVVKQRLKI